MNHIQNVKTVQKKYVLIVGTHIVQITVEVNIYTTLSLNIKSIQMVLKKLFIKLSI